MLLYLAGSLTPKRLLEMGDSVGAKNFLFTYAHKGARDCAVYFVEQQRADLRVFIDSGAFTVWKKGKLVVLEEYIKFVKGIKEKAICTLTVAALDVIAGSWGGPPPTPEQFEIACVQGWKNYLTMKEHGIQSLPTFHQGDDFKWLDILADETNYIGVAPRKKGKTPAEKREWLNRVFRRISERGQIQTLKTHGLGISSPGYMRTFPFYSVDSTAWLEGGKHASYAYFDGYRIVRKGPSEWRNDTSHCLQAVHRYRKSSRAGDEND